MKTTIVRGFGLSQEQMAAFVKGAIVTLQPDPDNEHDKNAVAVLMDGQPVGYIANSEKTVEKKTVSATHYKKYLDDKKVSSASALLIHQLDKEPEEGEKHCVRWLAELFPVPVWDSDTQQRDGSLVLTVGGLAVMHADKANVIQNFPSFKRGDLVMKLETGANGSLEAFLWRKDCLNTTGAAPAGTVLNPPQELMFALQSSSILPVTPVKTIGNAKYQVSVNLDRTDMSEFYGDMTRVIESCILQAKDVKIRVNYLLSQIVPPHIIHGVLQSMQRQDNPQSIIPPKQLYRQTGKDDYLTRALAYHLAGKNIRLVGEKGAGKNTLVSSACWALFQPLCRVQGNSDMDKFDLLGGQALDEKGTKFVLSNMMETLQKGGDVVLDEINSIKPEIAIALHSLTDDDRRVEVPGFGLVKMHPRARFWATMNEDYVGTGELNSATADRFVALHLGDQDGLQEMLKARFPEAPESDIRACCTIYDSIKNAVHEGTCSSDVITMRGFIDAFDAAKWLPLRQALLDNVAGRPQDRDERKAVASFIQAAFPV